MGFAHGNKYMYSTTNEDERLIQFVDLLIMKIMNINGTLLKFVQLKFTLY